MNPKTSPSTSFVFQTETFSNFFFAILKCIVMFTGEVDYQDMFYDKEKDATTGPVVGHILYAAFVLIVSILDHDEPPADSIK